jgi:hypothetical protein
MRRTLLGLMLVALAARPTSAQLVVTDPAVTVRNSITAVLKEYLLKVQQDQHRKFRRMARRLSVFTNLDKYAVLDPPRWRTRRPEEFLFDGEYNDALKFGDPSGTAYLRITQPVIATQQTMNRLSPAARRVFEARLATVNLADAAAIASTNDTGQLRANGKRELPAIDALEANVIDPSSVQSGTAVLDKISGAVLIGARQRQARTQLLTGVVEQLLIDSKRARDTEASAMNMQLVTWRDARGANKAFVKGTGDALRTWRQP